MSATRPSPYFCTSKPSPDAPPCSTQTAQQVAGACQTWCPRGSCMPGQQRDNQQAETRQQAGIVRPTLPLGSCSCVRSLASLALSCTPVWQADCLLFERFVAERACVAGAIPVQPSAHSAASKHTTPVGMLRHRLRPAEQQQLTAAHLTQMVLCGLMAADRAAGKGVQRHSFTLGKTCMRMRAKQQQRQAQQTAGRSAAPARMLHCAITDAHMHGCSPCSSEFETSAR